MHHLVFDLDRDGWGSAALVAAQLGPESCCLHPTREKSVVSILGSWPSEGDALWVLDLPGPTDWTHLSLPRGVRLLWVDHHMASWQGRVPDAVEVFLPRSRKPTTTMSQLVAHGLVTLPRAVAFIRQLCAPVADDDWGLAFDGLSEMAPRFPVLEDRLAELIVAGPLGGDLPDELQPAVTLARAHLEVVENVLARAPSEVGDDMVVTHLEDAHLVPLKRYSLALRARHPGKLIVLMHRGSTLYCGRDSGSVGLDLVAHFLARGLDPKGHPYVCFVRVPRAQMPVELVALREATETIRAGEGE